MFFSVKLFIPQLANIQNFFFQNNALETPKIEQSGFIGGRERKRGHMGRDGRQILAPVTDGLVSGARSWLGWVLPLGSFFMLELMNN